MAARDGTPREDSTTRTWPIIAVKDVAKSAAWYTRLLSASNNHPGATLFDQILDTDGAVLLCLHHWAHRARYSTPGWRPTTDIFKLKGADGDTYLVRYDERSNTWELTMFRAERVGG